jgi:hypothetical protein
MVSLSNALRAQKTCGQTHFMRQDGAICNNGVERHLKCKVESANTYNFLTEALGVAFPYGIYDIRKNIG